MTPTERSALLAVRERLAGEMAAIDRLLASPAEPVAMAPASEPKLMRLADFCKTRSIARRTLDDWIKEGLPTRGQGRRRRVLVEDADRWLGGRGTRG